MTSIAFWWYGSLVTMRRGEAFLLALILLTLHALLVSYLLRRGMD